MSGQDTWIRVKGYYTTIFPVYVGHAYALDARFNSKHVQVQIPVWLHRCSSMSSKPGAVPLCKCRKDIKSHISTYLNPHCLNREHKALSHCELISVNLCKSTGQIFSWCKIFHLIVSINRGICASYSKKITAKKYN